MKKIQILIGVFLAQLAFSQYMIVGKDSIALEDFKKENKYGLENVGIEKTLSSTQDFLLLQQFAAEKKADTMTYFRMRLADREGELREQKFYDPKLMDNLTTEFVNNNQVERNVQIFFVEKKSGDTTDYQKIYNDVISGKLSMEDAMKNAGMAETKAVYIKPGVLDDKMYSELVNLQNGGYTKLLNNSGFASFAKLISTRPSLGYIIFGTLSYPNDANATKMKTDIETAFKSGKKYQEVAALYGSTETEKKNGGLVMGSPSLPDEVYNALKGKTKDYNTAPIVFGDKYFIFHVYDILPYQMTEKNKSFFQKEMLNTNYAEKLQEKTIAGLKKNGSYFESPDYEKIKSSFAAFSSFTNDNAVLYRYGKHQFTYGELKKELAGRMTDLQEIPNDQWNELMKYRNGKFVMQAYSDDFSLRPEIKKELEAFSKNLYSEYIFSEYLKKEVENNPKWLTDYFEANKSKYIWDERASGRVAILSDAKMKSEIEKEIKNPKNWEELKKKYYGKLDSKNQILVHLEEGKMDKNADVFSVNKVPFKPGTYSTIIGDRTLVIAIDEIVKPTQMTFDEAKETIVDAVTEQKLQQTIEQQRAKTKIVVDSVFLKDLEKNFKK